MTSRISFGICLLVIASALGGCVVKNGGESAAIGPGTSGAGDDNETSGPTAVIMIMANGTQVYSSAEASDGSSGGNGTGNTTASGNTTSAGGNTTGASGTVSPSPGPTSSAAAPTSSAASPTSSLDAAPMQTTSSAANSTNATDDNSTSNESDVLIEPGVNVTFDASESEGTNLSFSWTIGNVTSENETFDHVFNETGTYDVTLTVTDLLNATDEETVVITVGSAGAAPGTVLAEEQHKFNGGSVSGGTPTCTSISSSTTDKTYTLMINDTVNGTAAEVTLMVLEASYGSAGMGARITVRDPNDEQIGQANNDLEIEGPLAPGEYTIVYRLCGVSSNHSTIDVTVTYVAR